MAGKFYVEPTLRHEPCRILWKSSRIGHSSDFCTMFMQAHEVGASVPLVRPGPRIFRVTYGRSGPSGAPGRCSAFHRIAAVIRVRPLG